MSNNQFFKPTARYRQYLILDLIEKNPHITQRDISKAIDVAVSMVNEYLDDYETQGLIKKKKHTTKNVDYIITKKGTEKKKLLNIEYLKASQVLYNSAKENIEKFLIEIENKGYENILLYGAGEVCEILLSTLKSNPSINLNCLAIIDDDTRKQGKEIFNIPIINRYWLEKYNHDGILISSFSNKNSIQNKLAELKYQENRILNFFE